MKPIYLDHSATTPVTPRALEAMLPYFSEDFGNPSSIYSYGQTSHNALEQCRARIAKCLGALKTEIFFTGGGTESDNWALRSVARMNRDKGRHIISTAIEHNAVLRTLSDLEEEGFEITLLTPDEHGCISPEQLEEALAARPDTILVSIMMANNVVGTVLDIASLAAVARKHRVSFHTDAVQAAGRIPVNVRKLGVDYLSVSAHKFGGPKGVGALFCKLPARIKPLLTGGGQEREMRSGTENVPGIVGMAQALEDAVGSLDQTSVHLNELARILDEAVLAVPGVMRTGHPEQRLPGFCSYAIEGLQHSVLLVGALNEVGVCVSSGSACSASSKEASHVLTALGYDKALASNSLRVTFGAENTPDQARYAAAQIPAAIQRIRAEQVQRAPRLEGRVSEIPAQ